MCKRSDIVGFIYLVYTPDSLYGTLEWRRMLTILFCNVSSLKNNDNKLSNSNGYRTTLCKIIFCIIIETNSAGSCMVSTIFLGNRNLQEIPCSIYIFSTEHGTLCWELYDCVDDWLVSRRGLGGVMC